jgi:tetratricopeptide (TPR) repeat protein/tRNA A-37 threonylcarbamoyl transferase component Bud32
MAKALLFILFLFNLSSGFLYSKNISYDRKKGTDDIHAFFDSHYQDEHKINNPEKILQSYRIIKKEPERAADAFITIMASKTPEEQMDFIKRNYDKISYLIFNLDIKQSSKFEEVFGVMVKNSFPISPDNLINFRDKANDMLAYFVKDYNRRMKMLPPDSRRVEISTATLNFHNPVSRLVGFGRSIKTSPDTAVKEADELSVEYSTEASVQNGIARLFLDESNYEEAEKYTTKAISVDNNNYDAYTMRAESRYSLNDVKGAIDDVKRASEIDPTNETTKLLAAFALKSPEFAKTDLSSLKDSFADGRAGSYDDTETSDVEIHPSNSSKEVVQSGVKEITVDEKKSDYYLKVALVKSQMEDYKEAVKYYNYAIDKNPDNMNAYLERANTYNLMGNYDEAIKDATYVLRNDPQNVNALNIRGWALYKKGDVQSAYDDTNKAIDIKPNFADAMFLRSLIYEKQNKFDEMLNDLEKASRLNPNYIPTFHDAVANYSYRAPNFMRYYDRNKDIFSKVNTDEPPPKPFNVKKFLILLGLTVMGGIFIGIALLHVFSPRLSTHSADTKSSISNNGVLSPNIFYEGVASGKYKILKKIGQGGMGSVYLATDQTLNREVAIKKMNEDIRMNEREKQRFIDEARTVAMLHHPNIIEIYTIFEEKKDIYLVFEYVDGISLDKKLDAEVRMPFYEVKDIIIEISKALDYAHNKNVIHRDLKLSNVMVSKEGFIKVMDFGLAKVLREAKARYSSSEVVGSPAYMAPEQDIGVFFKESDMYSLGVCIYEMLSGDLPFSGPDYHYQKEKKLYTPISSIVVGLPSAIDDIISKLLDPKPENRYSSIKEFLSDFNKL